MTATRDIYDVTDDLFQMFEAIRVIFQRWTKESPDAFLQEMQKFRTLETELEQLTGDEESAHKIILGIYRSVFPQAHSHQRTGV